MRLIILSWFVVFLCCAAVSAREVAGGSKQDVEQLKLLLQALQRRHHQYNPLWVRFRIKSDESAAFLRLMAVRQDSERHTELNCEYACKGEMTRTWSKADGLIDEKDWMKGEDFNIYNGEISLRPSGERNVYFLTKAPNPYTACELPTSIIGENLLREDLEFWAAGKARITVILAEEQAKDGEAMLHFTLGWPEQDGRIECWVIASQEWTLKRFDEYIKGRLVRAHEVQDFTTSGGVYYPKRGSRTDYGPNDGKLHRKTVFEVERLETQENRIPDNLFRFDIPKGGQVWDQDLQVMIRDTELSQSHLNEMMNHLKTRNVWVPWIWVSLCSLIVCVLLLLVYRRWRRQQSGFSVAGSIRMSRSL